MLWGIAIKHTSDPQTGLAVLQAFLYEHTPLAPLRVMAARVGHFFQIPLPGFHPFVVFGPEANRRILITERERLAWRNPDPVTDLLGHGVLVTDGAEHDHYRNLMEPYLHPGQLPGYLEMMRRQTARVTSLWQDGQTVDMLVESRKIALLIVMEALFSVDFWDDLPHLWKPILKTIEYISPGAWIIWRNIPRPGYSKYLKRVDEYLLNLISARRLASPNPDLLQHLLDAGLDDQRIRDQMLTMMIAGHDTSTALLAWSFHLLGEHPKVYGRLRSELDASAGKHPHLLDEVIKEALRLYPPIHMGNRVVTEPVEFDGTTVPSGERIIYSIYLTHRDGKIWEKPDEFCPERFEHGRKTPPMSYVPFGGGPRACIGAAFGLAEARVVISELLLNFDFEPCGPQAHAHMGATLEPRPGVFMKITRKQTGRL